MSDDEYGRVPAGWYPDPLGLPQLRWWDNHAWTEHVSDARQPMTATQPAAATMFADDDEPLTRRGRRSAQSAAAGDDDPTSLPTVHSLRELPAVDETNIVETNVDETDIVEITIVEIDTAVDEAPALVEPAASVPSVSVPSTSVPSASAPATSVPATDTSPADPASAWAAAAFSDPIAAGAQNAAPWVPLQQGSASAGAAGSAPVHGSAGAYTSAPGYGSAPAYGSAPGAPAYVPSWNESPISASDPGRRGTHQVLGTTAPHVQSVEVWAMALLPMLQLLVSLLVVAAFTSGPSTLLMAIIWLAPYPIGLVLAALDARTLRRRGVDRPAPCAWALLGTPIYLIARAVRLSRISGAGYGPVAVWLLLTGLIGASVLAVPGLVIAAFPSGFAAEAAESIEATARSIGNSMEVECPATPPLFIGQQLRCPALTSAGEDIVVTVSLQRSNGWIAWQVDDWGIFTVVR